MTLPYGQDWPDTDKWAEPDGTVHNGQHAEAPPEQHRGQLRMAKRFAAEHAEALIFVHGLGWHVWDGTRWAPDTDGAAMRAAVATTDAALRQAADLHGSDRHELQSDVRRCESETGLRGVLGIASALRPLATAATAINSEPYLFNCANGTLDLRTAELVPHNPRHLITKVAGTALHPDAVSGVLDDFLSTVLPDEDVRAFVQRLFGYALLGRVREHVLPIFSGTGCNGKGTLLEAVLRAFGDYGLSLNPEVLMESGPRHTTEQADLFGVRLAITSETNEGRPLAAATVKRLTGGDTIRARRMRQDTFEFEPSHTLIMATNHRPRVSGDDAAMWRRLRVVPFDMVVTNPDVGLPEKLAADLPAVLAWAFQGYLSYLAAGLSEPETVRQRTDAYREENDALGRFLDERTEQGRDKTARAGDLWNAWRAWCADNGEESGSTVMFARRVTERGYEKKNTNRGAVYRGLGLS